MTEGPKIDDNEIPQLESLENDITVAAESARSGEIGPDGEPPRASEPEAGAEPTEATTQPEGTDPEAKERPKRPWRNAADPFIKRISQHLNQRGRTSHTLSVPLGKARLLVTPKEQDLVLAAAAGEQASCGMDALIRDALGMRIMVLAHLRTLSKADGADRNPAMYAVRNDVEIAQELAFEMHGIISEESAAGEIENAKELSVYRRSLLDITEQGMEVLGGHGEGLDLPEGAVALKVGQHGKNVQEYDEKAAARARASAQQTKQKKEWAVSVSRKRKQMAAVVVLFAVLAVILAYLWVHRPRELNQFNVNDFKKVPGIEQVINRAPGLIIMVNEAKWNGLDRDARETWTRQVVDKAKSEGYRRVEFRSTGSTGLAIWTGGKKITLK